MTEMLRCSRSKKMDIKDTRLITPAALAGLIRLVDAEGRSSCRTAKEVFSDAFREGRGSRRKS